MIPELSEIEEWPVSEMLKREKELLGIYVSGHPLQAFKDEIDAFAKPVIGHLSETPSGQLVLVCGLIGDLQTRQDRKGSDYGVFQFGGFYGFSSDFSVFIDL